MKGDTMNCDSCGREVPPDARFCPACGTAVAETVAEGPTDGAAAQSDADAAAEPEETDAAAEPAAAGHPDDEDAADASDAEEAAERPAGRSTVVTVLGNILAVVAGGALGALTGVVILRLL